MDSARKDVDNKGDYGNEQQKGKKKDSKRCPWNWRTCETLAAVAAALSASETHGEHDSLELFNNCADEYILAVNNAVAEGK